MVTKCNVCAGTGMVPEKVHGWLTTVMCRPCLGQGYLADTISELHAEAKRLGRHMYGGFTGTYFQFEKAEVVYDVRAREYVGVVPCPDCGEQPIFHYFVNKSFYPNGALSRSENCVTVYCFGKCGGTGLRPWNTSRLTAVHLWNALALCIHTHGEWTATWEQLASVGKLYRPRPGEVLKAHATV